MAPGRVDKVSVSAEGRTVRLIGPVMVFIGLLESVAVTVRSHVPAMVGVPVMRHAEPRASPGGSEPDTMTHE